MVCKTFKYRLYPTYNQVARINDTINLCRLLYNCALEQRFRAYKSSHTSVNKYDQMAELPELKGAFPAYSQVYSQVLQDVLKRLDKSFMNFFRRLKSGDKPGFPRYQGVNRYHSFTYPQPRENMTPVNGKMYLPKIGKVKIKLHREMPGKIKTVTITRINSKYYACFTVEVEPCALPATNKQVGIDMGVSSFVATSDGLLVESPRFFRKAEKRLKTLQRKVSRRKKGSNRRIKAVRQLAKTHEYIANQRKDIAHKISRYLVDNYDLIAHEDLRVKNMVKNHHLSKSIHDSAWGVFFNILAYKAEEAGREIAKVPPHYTSQICSGCGTIVKKSLSVRVHVCPHCGLVLDRDVNAARNILAIARKLGSDGAFGDGLAIAD